MCQYEVLGPAYASLPAARSSVEARFRRALCMSSFALTLPPLFQTPNLRLFRLHSGADNSIYSPLGALGGSFMGLPAFFVFFCPFLRGCKQLRSTTGVYTKDWAPVVLHGTTSHPPPPPGPPPATNGNDPRKCCGPLMGNTWVSGTREAWVSQPKDPPPLCPPSR